MKAESPIAMPRRLVAELGALQGGVADTSTLIYLERLQLLGLAAQFFRLVVIPQVIREFGARPPAAVVISEIQPGPADQAVCQAAVALNLPVFTEDRGIIRAAGRAGLSYYNTLMLLLAFHVQGRLDALACRSAMNRLLGFARYSPRVIAVGEAVWAAIRQQSAEADS